MNQILGQDRALASLKAMLFSGRLHHAFIFHGPSGVGKGTTALALAKVLLCHDARPDPVMGRSACGLCESCRRLGASPDSSGQGSDEPDDAAELGEGRGGETGGGMGGGIGGKIGGKIGGEIGGEIGGGGQGGQGGQGGDLYWINKELARYSSDPAVRSRKQTTIPFDVLEEFLIQPVYRTSRLKHGKVFVVDQADAITPQGQNILLKTMEEPPAGTYLILLTSNEDRLLTTIRSRCQRVAFVPLSRQVVAQGLKRYPEAASLTGVQRDWLVDFADGSLGRLELALKYHLEEWHQAIVPMLGVRDETELGKAMAQRIDGFAQAWVDEHENASKEAANRQGASLMWALVAQWARSGLADAARSSVGQPVESAQAAAAPWIRTIEAIRQAESELAANLNMGLVCDHLALSLAV